MRKPLPKALDIDCKGGLTSEFTPHAGIAWQPCEQEASGTVREWAEATYAPSRVPEQRDRQPYRYGTAAERLGIRQLVRNHTAGVVDCARLLKNSTE